MQILTYSILIATSWDVDYCCHPYVIYEDTECGDIKKCASHSRAHTDPTVCILITVVACFMSVVLPHKLHISRNKPYSQYLSILIYISSLHVTFCVYLCLPRCVSQPCRRNRPEISVAKSEHISWSRYMSRYTCVCPCVFSFCGVWIPLMGKELTL